MNRLFNCFILLQADTTCIGLLDLGTHHLNSGFIVIPYFHFFKCYHLTEAMFRLRWNYRLRPPLSPSVLTISSFSSRIRHFEAQWVSAPFVWTQARVVILLRRLSVAHNINVCLMIPDTLFQSHLQILPLLLNNIGETYTYIVFYIFVFVCSFSRNRLDILHYPPAPWHKCQFRLLRFVQKVLPASYSP